MALPMLVGGSECGPSNPLQGLSKQFDQDRGIQQDHFGASRAGSSREVFRSQHLATSSPDQDATRFFSGDHASASHFSSDGIYDFGGLYTALPLPQTSVLQAPQIQQSPLESWASDFQMQQPLQSAVNIHAAVKPLMEASSNAHALLHSTTISQVPMQRSMPLNNFRMNSISMFAPQIHNPIVNHSISWEKEFSAQELALNTTNAPVIQQEQQQPETTQLSRNEGDELARAAGLLLENVKHEQNPKFQNSQFMGLMKQLRDGMVVVEGNQMVENDGRSFSASRADVKGKGKAVDTPMLHSRLVHNEEAMQPMASVQSTEARATVEDANDAYFRQENEDFQRYWNATNRPFHPVNAMQSADTAEWDKLQQDWDKFEATTSGIKSIDSYQFQDYNPYLLGDSSKTRHHTLHSQAHSILQSVLELEAAVQHDMLNAQQENEREHKALQALRRAVEIDPTHLPTWLALAVSYTNDGNRQETYNTIREWVLRNEKYATANTSAYITERYNQLIQCLIAMARSNLSGEVDADIQIALAVLLNTNEDYEKPRLFPNGTAVRPDDWLLYNRVGATMANSGRALNPGYIRARRSALQDSDGVKDSSGLNEKRGITSTALWDSLRTTCLHMQRTDLAGLCDLRDIEGFRAKFQF
ncbi:hypothetical protein BDQ17DRAFT_1387762 [Cyathus striatus]|nr:hypothetical protein BDQ17DRAFT_1387762 [Cyathus striatus]